MYVVLSACALLVTEGVYVCVHCTALECDLSVFATVTNAVSETSD